MTRMQEKKERKILFSALAMIVSFASAPVVLEYFNGLFEQVGIRGIVPMTVGEYATYLGTVSAIVWAVYAFGAERTDKERQDQTQKNNERPELSFLLRNDGVITVRNVGAFDAVCVSNCDKPLIDRLPPAKEINLAWVGLDDFEDLVLRYEEIIVIDEYVIQDISGLNVDIFAYSINGVLWSYECDLSFDGQSRIVVSESWS